VIGPTGGVRVMVTTKPVDLPGAEGLATRLREAMTADPFSGTIYLSGPSGHNKRHSKASDHFLELWDRKSVINLVGVTASNTKWPCAPEALCHFLLGVIQISLVTSLAKRTSSRRSHDGPKGKVPSHKAVYSFSKVGRCRGSEPK
jgi:hypothetical protein